jgi:SPP1 family predicted phage head-tail adaptor
MKLRQSQTSATYLLPDPGELDKRVTIRRREDIPTDDFGIGATFPESFSTWAKVVQTSATTYLGTVQTEKAMTHYVTIRWRSGITGDHEVVYDDQVFRIHRVRDLNSKRRFLLLECEELGEDRRRTYAAESAFTR